MLGSKETKNGFFSQYELHAVTGTTMASLRCLRLGQKIPIHYSGHRQAVLPNNGPPDRYEQAIYQIEKFY